MKKSPFEPNCHYDYPNKCDCSEDDKCGCTYPNNLSLGYNKDCFDTTLNPTNSEKIVFEKINKQEDNNSINAIDENWKTSIQHHKKSSNYHSSANTSTH